MIASKSDIIPAAAFFSKCLRLEQLALVTLLYGWELALASPSEKPSPSLIELQPIEVSSTVESLECELGWSVCRFQTATDQSDDDEPLKMTVRPSSPGGAGAQLSTESNLTVSTSAQPGARASIIGLGRGAEETDVRTLGISLNPPQGGGFDLSSFPSSFWATYTSSLGPQSGASSFRDPRAPSGVFELLPWTAASVMGPEQDRSTFRLLQNASSLSVFESSLGFTLADRSAAIWTGLSSGLIQGPAAALSWLSSKAPRSSGGVWDAHVLFADLKSESSGSESFPTPGATQRSQRLIPILGWQRQGEAGGRLLLRAFADSGVIDYQAPSIPYTSVDRSTRAGVSVAQEWGPPVRLDLGVSLERSQLQQTGLGDFSEWTGLIWVQRPLNWTESLKVSPRLQWLWLSNLASRGGPLADIEFRKHLDGAVSLIHMSLGSALRSPSLLNRFYESPFFTGNPQLEPERVWNANLGVSGAYWRANVFQEVRDNALITTGVVRPFNSGRAHVFGAELSARRAIDDRGRWVLHQSLRYARSRVESLAAGFPLMPEWSAQGGVRWVNGPSWESSLSYRAVSDFDTGLGSTLKGFGLWNAEVMGQIEVFSIPLRAAFRVENLLAQKAYWIPDYPVPGRVFSVALSSELE